MAVDYIIVGGGAAGCVLANRLSADPGVRVVLIEAGGNDSSPFIRMPAGYLALMRSGALDWHYHTDPQPHMDNRVMFWPRGKVLGGSSSINGMVYIRGHASDYDGWEQMGNRGWSYADCLPYFKRSERREAGADDYHGGDGLLYTSRALASNHPLTRAWFEAGKQAGYPETDDFNGAQLEGFGPIDSTIMHNERASVSRCYLDPARGRQNLKIIVKALATRVLIENGRATGIEYRKAGRLHTLRAEREIVLCGGAINSPQLLQLSGVGDGDLLRTFDIKVHADVKGVGRNLQDHLGCGVKQRCTQPVSFYPYTRPLRAASAMVQYLLTKSGPATSHGLESMAFLRSRPDLIVPDLQYFFASVMYSDHGRKIINEHGFMAYFNLARPESRGAIRIRSKDPAQHPSIQPNYLQADADIRTMRDGIKIGREIIAQQAFDGLRGTEYGPGSGATRDADIDRYVRQTAETIYHPVGTCKMGHDFDAVVDDRLRVHGIDALRVIDASIMPTLISGNTNAATVMIAEKGADFISDKPPLPPAFPRGRHAAARA